MCVDLLYILGRSFWQTMAGKEWGAFLLPQCPEALINLRSEGAEPVLQLLDWTGLG